MIVNYVVPGCPPPFSADTAAVLCMPNLSVPASFHLLKVLLDVYVPLVYSHSCALISVKRQHARSLLSDP